MALTGQNKFSTKNFGMSGYLKGSDKDGTGLNEQWGLVGDTWVVGCRILDTLVFPEFNELNPDRWHPVFSTEFGIY
jgi:inositol oxygenase